MEWGAQGGKEPCGLAEGPVEQSVRDGLAGVVRVADETGRKQQHPLPAIDEDEFDETSRVLQNIKDSSSCFDITAYAEKDQDKLMQDLYPIAQVDMGRKLLSELSEDPEGDTVLLGTTDAEKNVKTNANEGSARDLLEECDPRQVFDGGKGGISKVYFNPGEDELAPAALKEKEGCDTAGYPMSSDTVLAHELIHALHNQEGESLINDTDCGNGRPTYFEEQRTAGLAPFEGEFFSERTYRQEHRDLGHEGYTDRPWYWKPPECQ